jgi:hypothetical protein
VVAADAVVAVGVDGCEDDWVLHGVQFFSSSYDRNGDTGRLNGMRGCDCGSGWARLPDWEYEGRPCG